MSKTLFLDIDGVLNSTKWYIDRGPNSRERPRDEIDPGTIIHLNRIIRLTGCDVVISSSWRLIYSLEEIRGLLNSFGFEGSIVSKTPRLQYPNRRGDEIRMWILDAPVMPKGICILDDDSDMGSLMPYLVKTNNAVGLTVDEVIKAVDMLNHKF